VVTGDSLREASGCTESPEIVADNKADWARARVWIFEPTLPSCFRHGEA